MKTVPSSLNSAWKKLSFAVAALLLLTGPQVVFAANIVWVSDNPPPNGFSGPVAGFADDAFITNLLQKAGHNVIRFSSDNSQTNLMTPAEINALNTNDLIILGRSLGSGAFQLPQAGQWNTNIAKPLIVMSPFLTRAANLGWFSGSSAFNDVPTPLQVPDLNNPKAAYLFGNVAMNGNTTVEFFDEAIDQNTSLTSDANQGGGVTLARSVNGTVGTVIAEWPAGAAVKNGSNVLSGYRMFFAGGSREASGAAVPTAGKENLTRAGEAIFLRAVTLAANNGVVPTVANILWVSDAPAAGFSGPGVDLTDGAYVRLLQNAGYNVNRYNSPDAATTLLTPAEIAAIDTNDLIIIGRATGSGAVATGQGNQWNTNITKPLIDIGPYLSRTTGPRLGWFVGDVGPDDSPAPLTPVNPNDPVTDYIFAGTAMNGTNTALPYDEAIDRNTSQILGDPVAGGVAYAKVTFAREDTGVIATGYAIAGFPAGTLVLNNADRLAGYRMFFSTGSREGATAPNAIPLYTGRENLTPSGEAVFLRAIQVALNNGVAPTTNAGPLTVTSFSPSSTNRQGGSLALNVTVSGGGPRTVQWQRDTGDGVTFTNIPTTVSAFPVATYSLPPLAFPQDNNARFRVIASNALNVVTSSVATVTVLRDTNAPVPQIAASLDGMSITICFDEPVDSSSAGEPLNYELNSGAGPDVTGATVLPDARLVVLSLTGPLGGTASLNISGISDAFGNSMTASKTLTATNVGLTLADVGTPTPASTNNVCDATKIEISGGGLDILSTADTMRLGYKTVSGDFDVRVRVASLVGVPDHLETTTKALLVARENTTAGARAVNIWVTPPAPGDNNFSSSARTTSGGATNALGASVVGAFPNPWLRIKRAGDVFTTYRGTNGVDWVEMGNTTIAMGPSAAVGLGVVSHRSGKLATATFSDFRFGSTAAPPSLSFARTGPFTPPRKGTNVTLSWPLTVTGFVLQSKPAVSNTVWTNVPGVVSNSLTLSNQTGSGIFRLISP